MKKSTQTIRRQGTAPILSLALTVSILFSFAACAKRAVDTAAVSRISFNVGADETQRNLVWYDQSAYDGVVQVARKSATGEGGFPAECRSFSAVRTNPAETSGLSGYCIYKATINELAENTEYVYRAGSPGNWSDTYSFKTGVFDQKFSFLFAGDAQIGVVDVANETTGWNTTLEKAKEWFKGQDLGFLISAGDQVHNINFNADEEYGGLLAPEYLKSLALAANVGNHDVMYSSAVTNHDERFNMPNSSPDCGIYIDEQGRKLGADYWYSYEGALFMALNSNVADVKEHVKFMENAIADYRKKNGGREPVWKVVTFHHSIYGTATQAEIAAFVKLRDNFAEIFYDLGIDAVLMGHDHVYTRTYMMGGGAKKLDPIKTGYTKAGDDNYAEYKKTYGPDGSGPVLYLTATSSSGSYYQAGEDITAYPYAAFKNQEESPNITKVDVDENSLKFTTYRTGTDQSGTTVDTFTLKRDQGPHAR